MRMRILAMAAVLAFSPCVLADNYYVNNITGSDTNTGATEAGALKTLQAAANRATDGDTVYVKATGTPYAPFAVSGLGGHVGYPVRFVGYHTTITDRNNGYGIPTSYNEADGYSAFPTTLPHIKGGSRTSGIGINFNGRDYIEVKNFYVSNVKDGVLLTASSNNCRVENVFCFDLGSTTANNSGNGIWVSGSDNVLFNCVVLNSAYWGIRASNCDDNLIEECAVYADDDSTAYSSCDYYFLIANGDGNQIKYCTAERPYAISHFGHGFTVQGWASLNWIAEDNSVENCVAVNMGEVILLRGVNARYNTFSNITSYVNSSDEENNSVYWGGIGGIKFVTGPHHNEFYDIELNNADTAIIFKAHYEPSVQFRDWNTAAANQSVGNNNYFEGCTFRCEVGIRMDDAEDETGSGAANQYAGGSLVDGSTLDVKNNEFVDCDFYWSSEAGDNNGFFHSAREASGNTMTGCGFFAFPRYVIPASWYVPPNSMVPLLDTEGKVPGFSFDSCIFWNPVGGVEVFPDYGGNNVYLDP